MVAILFGVNKFIDNKIIDLRSEIRDNLEALFEGESSGGALVSNNDGWFFQILATILFVITKKRLSPQNQTRNQSQR